MRQFNKASEFKDGLSGRSWTTPTTCHVGVRIEGRMREVYRIELALKQRHNNYRDMVYVSDMLDEGHWFAPTVEKRPVGNCARTVMLQMARKYEKLARKQLLGYETPPKSPNSASQKVSAIGRGARS